MMEPIKLWQNLSDENKSLVRKIGVAALGLYVLLQLVNLFLPLVITAAIAIWAYKEFVDNNSKVL